MTAKEKLFMILQWDTIDMANDNVERMLSQAQLYKIVSSKQRQQGLYTS